MTERAEVVWAALTLMRTARAATLATSDAGQPAASLVTPAPAPDGSLLMLLSGLSPHTRHLRDDPRCGVMVMGEATGLNPQTAPRLSLAGTATPEPDAALKARWVARHPYAAFYADLSDFRILRFRATAGQFIGGFASAHRLSQAELTPDPAAVAAIAEAEPALLAAFTPPGGWHLAAVDVAGADLVRGEELRRLPFAGPVATAAAARDELTRLLS